MLLQPPLLCKKLVQIYVYFAGKADSDPPLPGSSHAFGIPLRSRFPANSANSSHLTLIPMTSGLTGIMFHFASAAYALCLPFIRTTPLCLFGFSLNLLYLLYFTLFRSPFFVLPSPFPVHPLRQATAGKSVGCRVRLTWRIRYVRVARRRPHRAYAALPGRDR